MARLRGQKKNGRDAAALATSVTLHILVIAALVSQATTIYTYPPSVAPAMDVQIVALPPPPPVIAPPPKTEPAPVPPKPKPPKPAPPKPTPPAPRTETPKPIVPPKVEPQKPAPRKPAPPEPAPPKPSPLPAPVAPPQKVAPPAPAPPKPAAPSIPTTMSKLNLHKAEKEAPANVPTLPVAPSTRAPGGGGPASPSPGASPRGSGLSSLPYGAMPSGGPGLRGTLVGCANADGVGLSPAERAHCNERFGAGAARAPALDPMSAEKRATFDHAAGRQDADRRYRNAGTTSTAAPSDPGSIAHGPASSEIFRHNAGDP